MFTSLLIISTFLTLIILTLAVTLSKKLNLDKEKNSPFECGFNPLYKTRISFSLHFFLIALIFIIFDVEILILIPAPLYPQITLQASLSILGFISILMGGLYYEWGQGKISWS